VSASRASLDFTVKIAALSARLRQQADVRNLHPFVEGFAHVIDREGCGSHGDQGFHLNACLSGRHDCGAKFHAILAQASSHINVSQWEWMTKRYPLGGAFRGRDAGDTSDFERAALGVFQATDGADYTWGHFYEGLGYGCAGGYLLGGDVYHLDFAFFAIVREFGHWV